MERRNLFFITVLVVLLLINIPGLYSESFQKKKTQEAEEHEVSVTLKLIRVYVTDKSGKPVIDLEKDDFELYDNRKRQKITDFERHAITSLPADKTKAEAKATTSSKKMERKFFLFFDFAFNCREGIRDSKKAALHFIDTNLQETDEVGILSFSTFRGFALHTHLTTDHKKVREIVSGFNLKEMSGIAKGYGADDEDMPDEILDLVQKQYRDHVLTFAGKVGDFAKILRYIPGNKHFILFSFGIYSDAIYGMPDFGEMSETGERANYKMILDDKSALRNEYESMIKELAASNCNVYVIKTVDRRGVGVPGFDPGDGGLSLQRLAVATGGEYFGNVMNYEKSMEKIQSTTGSFYVLGYYIDEKWDGKYHRIKVKIKRKDCEARVQEGYFNPKPFTKYSKNEKKIHLLDLALNENSQFQSPLSFPLMALPCLVRGRSSLLMMSKIPVDRIQEVTKENIEIASLIFDKEENQVESCIAEVNLSNLPETNIYQYSFSQLSPGEYRCRVVIRNMETGNAAVASSSIVIPEIPDSDLMLNPPLLLMPGEKAVYIESTKKKDSEKRYSSLITAYPYDASQYVPLIGELPRGVSRILALVKCSYFEIQDPKISISTRLVHKKTGKEIGGKITVLNKYVEKDSIISLLEFQIEELVSGKYKLDFIARERKTQAESEISTNFIVR